jgi:hypothetical protein
VQVAQKENFLNPSKSLDFAGCPKRKLFEPIKIFGFCWLPKKKTFEIALFDFSFRKIWREP